MQTLTRARWPWLPIVAYCVQVGAVVYGFAWHIDRPLGGFIPHRGGPTEVRVYAMSSSLEAERFRAGRTLELLAVNGRDVCETADGARCGVEWARSLIDTTAGARNRFVVRVPPSQARHAVELVAGPGEIGAILAWGSYSFVMVALGLVYALIGFITWYRRPDDPAALPFLLFSLAMGSTLSGPWCVDTFTLLMHGQASLFSALLMPFLFLFAHSFATRSDASRTLRFRVQLVFALSVGLAEGICQVLSVFGVHRLRPVVAMFTPLMIAGAVVAFVLSLHSIWRAARPPSPLSHRRRARVLALAVALGFAYPTVWLIFREPIFHAGYDQLAFWGLVASFSTVPVLIGYAMVRHRMFDLRIVLRQGLVYTLLSVALALAYVAVVVGAYRLAGTRESAAAPVVAAIVVAVLFGVIRVRLERWIDAMVFRGRAVFRRAIGLTGKSLSLARHPADVAPALRPALISALGLTRAYVVERDADRERLHCYLVGNLPDPDTDHAPPTLRSEALLSECAALAHCFARAAVVHSVDPAVPHERDGHSFWDHHGLEASVPFGAGGDDRPAGLLLLGPKDNGRPLDPEDLSLVEALGSQVALALASARAFERLADSGRTLLHLTQGIVHEANTPLGVLESSVDTLERALTQLDDDDPARRGRALLGSRNSIATARLSGDRLKALIGDLKAYVNLEETDRAPTDLCACLGEVVRDASRVANHPIELECPEGPALVDGYPAKLRHVFGGVLDNALSATTNGAPVRVRLAREGTSWLATVRDSGTGMSPEVLANVFEFGISTKRAQNRMGLRIGLPYARRVVESLGGRISVRSEPGAGTEVRIGLPALAEEAVER